MRFRIGASEEGSPTRARIGAGEVGASRGVGERFRNWGGRGAVAKGQRSDPQARQRNLSRLRARTLQLGISASQRPQQACSRRWRCRKRLPLAGSKGPSVPKRNTPHCGSRSALCRLYAARAWTNPGLGVCRQRFLGEESEVRHEAHDVGEALHAPSPRTRARWSDPEERIDA